ncbi:MAG: hypothetical protein ABL977_07945 [Candidatus Eisenbacteria bacterium]
MSRPTTLRGNIDKVSIESLISPEFRATDGPAEEAPADVAPAEASAVADAVADTRSSEAVTPRAPVAAPSGEPAAGTPELRVVPGTPSVPAANANAAPTDVPKPERPPLTLVRPLLDDPEFNVEPSPSPELPTPRKRASAAAPPPVSAPAPEPEHAEEFDNDEAIAEAEGKPVDPEDFARATDEFMRSSPVLGAAPRRGARTQELPDFGDPDAIAVASMVQDLTRMEVPKERHAEVRARLLDLARRLERGELEWSALRKAVWFAMEHPELARRLMPVLLPWIDRAA